MNIEPNDQHGDGQTIAPLAPYRTLSVFERRRIAEPHTTITTQSCHAVTTLCAFQDKEVQGVQKLVPYKIVEGQDGAAWVEVQGNKMSPSQVSETAVVLLCIIASAVVVLLLDVVYSQRGCCCRCGVWVWLS